MIRESIPSQLALSVSESDIGVLSTDMGIRLRGTLAGKINRIKQALINDAV